MLINAHHRRCLNRRPETDVGPHSCSLNHGGVQIRTAAVVSDPVPYLIEYLNWQAWFMIPRTVERDKVGVVTRDQRILRFFVFTITLNPKDGYTGRHRFGQHQTKGFITRKESISIERGVNRSNVILDADEMNSIDNAPLLTQSHQLLSFGAVAADDAVPTGRQP